MKETETAKHTYIRRDSGVVVLKPRGNLIGGPETEELDRLIDDLDRDGAPSLVLNLGAVQLVNSLAISRLVHAHLRFTKRNARVVLCNLERRVRNLFETTRLEQVFRLARTEDDAVAAARDKPA